MKRLLSFFVLTLGQSFNDKKGNRLLIYRVAHNLTFNCSSDDFFVLKILVFGLKNRNKKSCNSRNRLFRHEPHGIGCCILEKAQNAAALFLWDKQSKQAGAPCACSRMLHSTYIF